MGESRLLVCLDYRPGNRQWLRDTLGCQPRRNPTTRRWEIARVHFRRLVEEIALAYGSVDVDVEFSTSERCDKRCREARGDDCSCSCMGENHGGAAYLKYWLEVGDSTLIAPGQRRRQFRVTRADVLRSRAAA